MDRLAKFFVEVCLLFLKNFWVHCPLKTACYGKRWGPHGYGFACGSGFLQTDGTSWVSFSDNLLIKLNVNWLNDFDCSEEELSAARPFVAIDTTAIKAPEGQGCPRCGGAVFAAEQMLAKGTTWHKRCFSCAECHRPLDSVLACDGPDKEIHCRGCYAKLFGPKGFGYGHTPVLSTNGESTLNKYELSFNLWFYF